MKYSRRPKGTGGLIRRKDGRWQATWTWRDDNDCKKVKTFYGKTQTEAIAKMRDAVAMGAHQLKSRSLSQLLDYFNDEVLIGRNLKEKTVKGYRYYADVIRPQIGHIQLAKLRVHHLDGVLTHELERGLTGGSVKLLRAYLKMVLAEGERLGWIVLTLSTKLKTIRAEEFRAQIYDLDELMNLIKAASGSPVQPAIVISGLCGLRLAEVCALEWDDVDFELKTLRVEKQYLGKGKFDQRTKTSSGMRTIPLPEPLLNYLADLKRHGRYIVSAANADKPLHPTFVSSESMRLMGVAQVKRIRFHDLRHSANNLLKQLGVPSATRRDILGHSNTNVTDNTYTQTVDWEMRDAMNKLGGMIDLSGNQDPPAK